VLPRASKRHKMIRDCFCSNCWFFYKGSCCREHPKPITTDQAGIQRAGNVLWPKVEPSDWCADHEKLLQEEEMDPIAGQE